MSNNNTLPMGTKLGYGIGQIAISLPYNLVGVFLLFFFTNVAGVQPAFAGTIFLVAILWAAFADPFIGNFSDNIRSKHGRRRPMLLIVAIPLAVTTWLLFTNFDFSGDLSRNVYYTILAILFYTAFTFTEVPFYSLGAEITSNFDERTRVRVVSSMFIYVAVLLAVNLPLFIVAKIVGSGGTPQYAWSLAAAVCGAIAILCILISWNSTRGKEIVLGEIDKKSDENNIFKVFAETLRIKPVKYVVLANFLYLLGMSIFTGVSVYVLTYVAHVEPALQSTALSVLPIATILWLPIINFLAPRLGKKKGYILLVGSACLAGAVFYFVGIYTFASVCIFNAVFALGNGSFWTLCFSMAYDTTEVDEFVNGKRREGVMVAYMSFAQKVGSAGAMWITGLVLQYVKYNGAALDQAEPALAGLSTLFTLIPSVFIALSVLCIFLYPLTKKKHEAILNALAKKKAGEEYSTTGFDDLL